MARKKILIVEDDEELIFLLKAQLNFFGYDTLSEKGGIEGIEAAVKESPDLIILDFHIHNLDGVEVCRRLKSSPATNAVPVVLFTGDTHKSAEDLQRQAGADGYIQKPFEPEQLQATIEALIGR